MRILLVFLVLVCVRGACSFRQAWFEGDDIVIAAGVAALINDNCGDDYRYSVQPGYYRLVEGIVRGMGGDIGLVPEVMFALSAIAGAWLVALGLLAFPKQLGTRERWVLSAVLLANPILWVSSQYGNTGLLSCALGTSAVVWLSRSPGRIGEACALLLWGCATLVRNDAVLLVGAIAWLLWRRHGLKGMVGRGAVLGVVMGAVLGAMIAFDPRMQNPLVAVGDHVLNDDVRTHFFKYLLWAMSPLPLVFALVGTGQLIHRRDSLLPALFLWMLPVGAFYFGSTTTPRYFLLMAFPLSMLTALGAVGVHRRLWGGRSRSVAAAIAVLLGLHLVVALGHF